jgi:ribosomal-protein-alanine N-acetyltransferase
MKRADLTAICKLERKIFPDPWPRSSFEALFGADGIGMIVAAHEGEVIGYACWEVCDRAAHLTNLAVAPEWRRKAVAKRLLQHILQVVAAEECRLVMLEVRPSSRDALSFYEESGFHKVYVKPDYYRRPTEDALVMIRQLQHGDRQDT